MDRRSRIVSLLSIALLVAGLVVPAGAQQADPVPPTLPVTDNPAVAMILRGSFDTPAEQIRAARMLANLGRPDLARQFLGRVNDARPDDAQLAALAERFGTATLVTLGNRPDLQPEARQLADAVLAVVNRSLQDPAQIARRIGQLRDVAPEVRAKAFAELVEGRAAAVPLLVAALADADRAAEHAGVRAVLVEMGPEAVGPMVAVLDSRQPQSMAQAIRVLAQVGTEASAVYLLGPCSSPTSDPAVRVLAQAALERLLGRAPTTEQAVRLLREQATAWFERRQPIEADVDGNVRRWRWDEAGKTCVLASLSAEVAGSMTAARLARDLYTLAGDDPAVRRLYLATMLEEAGYQAGLDQPLPDGPGTAVAEAAGFGPSVIDDLLQYAMAGDHAPAATAAARILGQIGTADALLRQGGQMSPLVGALRHADRRVRLAAAEAVIRLNPAGPYPGSSYLPETLAYFITAGGDRRVLVAGPGTEASRRLVGLLAGEGYVVDTATSGREVLRMAAASPDYELALVDAGIDQPAIELLVQQLRHDCRSATLRLGLIARDGYLPRARHVASQDPLTLAFVRSHTDEAFAEDLRQLTALAPLAMVGVAERQRQAVWAMDRLAELSGEDHRLYDLGRVEDAVLIALVTPGLEAKAAVVLGGLGTARAQQVLVDVASRWVQPIEVRQAAATAFRRNTEANGILLTSQQILRQYDRYNESKDFDRPTQQVLGLILDSIEAPARAASANAGISQSPTP